jgi:hypothetical protein
MASWQTQRLPRIAPLVCVVVVFSCAFLGIHVSFLGRSDTAIALRSGFHRIKATGKLLS